MRRLGESRWENTEKSWRKNGFSLQDVQKAAGWLLEKMICWAVWQRVLALLAFFAGIAALDIFFSSRLQRWSSHSIAELAGLSFLFSNALFLFWLSTFPKWEIEKRKKLADRFTAITFFIVLILMIVDIFLTMAHLK